MTEREKMLAGELYDAGDEQLVRDRIAARRLTRALNTSLETEFDQREQLLRQLLGSAGEEVYMEPPFHCDYGYNIHVGDAFYANFNCVILDVCPVHIGSRVMLGPNVSVYAAGHPIDAQVRAEPLEFGAPVTIGDDVWIGGSTVVMPGVTIGSNVVIGAGSMVTRDIPDNVVAVGSPCRVLREITEEDTRYWRERSEAYHRQRQAESESVNLD